MCFVGTVALFSLWTKSFRGDQNLDPSWQFLGFIRTCHNPIGRASTKNWKLRLFHIKWRVGKKVTNYVFLFIRTCHHPIREAIDQKLKYKQNPYEMKDWKKCHNSNVLQSILDKKNCIRIISTRSVVLDRFQSVFMGKIFFLKK